MLVLAGCWPPGENVVIVGVCSLEVDLGLWRCGSLELEARACPNGTVSAPPNVAGRPEDELDVSENPQEARREAFVGFSSAGKVMGLALLALAPSYKRGHVRAISTMVCVGYCV